MKLTESVIAQFEAEQTAHGTRIALGNVLWQLASDLFKDIGVTKVSTSYKRA